MRRTYVSGGVDGGIRIDDGESSSESGKLFFGNQTAVNGCAVIVATAAAADDTAIAARPAR